MIRELLAIRPMEPEFCRRDLLVSNPMAWLISVDGMLVDARMAPPEIQAEARRRGLIPDVPIDPAEGGSGVAPRGEDPAMGLAEAVADIVASLRERPPFGDDASDGWDSIVRTVAERDGLPTGEVEAIENAISDACRRWTDEQRRAIWHQTWSGMADDADENAGETSSSEIEVWLQIELLDEVTRAAWHEAEERKSAMPKDSNRRRGRPG